MNYRNHFTSRAIKAIEFAQYAARELEQDYIGTEHILLGLLHEEGSVAFAALQAAGLTFDAVMQRVEAMVAGDAEYPSDNPYYTPRAKRVMEGAVEEAQTLGHNYIGTEHILLSLLEETEGAAAELLIGMGVDIDALQGEVLDRIDHPHPEGDGEPSRTEKAKGRQAPQLIKKYGRNLNDMAKEDRMDPVIGRDKEIQRVIQILARRTKNNPILLGETGVGKTELAKALSEALFGTEDAIIRFDMSEYMEKYAVSRMVGAPPGYVGYEEGGQLTNAVRRKPYSIILLDEIEKAHPDVFNVLLQVLDDGRLTDGKGRTVDFRNTVIIMTSNAGATLLKKSAPALGFAVGSGDEKQEAEDAAKKRVLGEVRHIFKPEFLNRIDELIVFHPLGREELSKIIDILLRDVRTRLAEKEIRLEVSPAAKNVLVEKGTDFKYGARPLKRAIQKLIEDEIAEHLLARDFKRGDTIQVRKNGAKLDFVRKETEKDRKDSKEKNVQDKAEKPVEA